MKPISRKDRAAFQNGPRMSVASVNDESKNGDIDDFLFLPSEENNADTYNEDGLYKFLNNETNKYSDEEVKIKALSLAINIAKLMSDVTLDSILKIADKIAVYIKK